jgi:hypothetical protein
MNPSHFESMSHRVRAAQPGVITALSSYFGSEEFLLRSSFSGATAEQDRVRVTLVQLRHMALDPRKAADARQHLSRGVVYLQFFGVTCIAGLFELELGSHALESIKEAVEANIGSAMFEAAGRALSWRTAARHASRRRQEKAILRRFSATLAWPTADAWRGFSREARELNAQLIAQVDNKRQELRDRQQRRIGRLVAAATPGVNGAGGYPQFLEVVAVQAFVPLH